MGGHYTIEDIYAGTCFLLPKLRSEIKPIWIVLTHPDDDIKRNVAIVTLTTKTGADKTTVYYEDARIASCLPIIQILNNHYPDSKLYDHFPDLILREIQQGIFESDFVSEEVQEYCRLRLNR